MEGKIFVRYVLPEKLFWKEIAEKLPEGYILQPKYRVFGYAIDYSFMNVYRKGLKAKLGLAKPLMTLYANTELKSFHIKCFSETHFLIIEPIIQTLKKLGYTIFITKVKEELKL